MANINDFKARLGGGVRPNLYEVEIAFPSSNATLTEQTKFLCRSAALPGSTQGLIEVPFRGRFLKIPGDRTFEAWTATFYNTGTFDLRGAFEAWINLGNKVNENIGTYSFGSSTAFGQYFQDIVIRQKTKEAKSTGGDPNSTLRSYKLIGAWPTTVSPITIAYDNNDALEEFDVEFQYQYFDTFAAGQQERDGSDRGLLTTQDITRAQF
jgi:hypothetical protein